MFKKKIKKKQAPATENGKVSGITIDMKSKGTQTKGTDIFSIILILSVF